jgi:catechol 2,3-dioxygenase-like lactoylglutathione lyase family enzyme
MIYGAHVLLYSDDAEADRAFLRDTLGLAGIDVGRGWLIFALPPAEVAVHPSDGAPRQVHGGHSLLGAVLYFMCDDVRAYVLRLAGMGVVCTEISEALGPPNDDPAAQRRRAGVVSAVASDGLRAERPPRIARICDPR